MDEDIARHIGAVSREIVSRDHDGRLARVLIATRDYDTTPEDLWDALTNPERIPRWLLPVSGDLRLGGTFQLEGNAGGEILTCDPPVRLGLTWGMGRDVSWVDVTLQANTSGGTSLRLEHTAHVPEEFWNQYGPGATGIGWELALMGLAIYLRTGEAVDPQDALAWPSTEQGMGFIHQISDAWAEESIADGTDASQARAAAEEVARFYTGEEAKP